MSLTLYDAKILGAAVKDARSKRHAPNSWKSLSRSKKI